MNALPRWFKIAYTAFVALLVPVYTVQYGLYNFLWFSNLALLGGLLAAWLESHRLACMMLVAVALPELGWMVDFLGGVWRGGAPPFGFVGYMFDRAIPLGVRALSLYHLLLPVVLFWMVWRLGYDPLAWWRWLPGGWAILLVSYLLATPEQSVNWVLGPGPGEQEWMPAWAWLGTVLVTSTLIWWLTHRFLFGIMRHFKRLA